MVDAEHQDHEALARRAAYILGDFSAAAEALRELDSLRAKGERAQIFFWQNTWIVRQAE